MYTGAMDTVVLAKRCCESLSIVGSKEMMGWRIKESKHASVCGCEGIALKRKVREPSYRV